MTGAVDVETVAKLSQRQAALADARLAEVVAERDALLERVALAVRELRGCSYVGHTSPVDILLGIADAERVRRGSWTTPENFAFDMDEVRPLVEASLRPPVPASNDRLCLSSMRPHLGSPYCTREHAHEGDHRMRRQSDTFTWPNEAAA